MVTDCPSDFSDDFVSTKCRKTSQTSQPYTYHLDVAVQSRSTNLTYANWFCASCNGDAADLASLKGDVFCNNLDIIDDCKLDVANDIMIDENYHAGQLREHSEKENFQLLQFRLKWMEKLNSNGKNAFYSRYQYKFFNLKINFLQSNI